MPMVWPEKFVPLSVTSIFESPAFAGIVNCAPRQVFAACELVAIVGAAENVHEELVAATVTGVQPVQPCTATALLGVDPGFAMVLAIVVELTALVAALVAIFPVFVAVVPVLVAVVPVFAAVVVELAAIDVVFVAVVPVFVAVVAVLAAVLPVFVAVVPVLVAVFPLLVAMLERLVFPVSCLAAVA